MSITDIHPPTRFQLRKQRLARLGALPISKPYKKKPKPPEPHAYNFCWQNMWCFDLVFGKPKKAKPTAHEVQMVTAEYYGISVFDILSHRKPSEIVIPRQVAMYVTSLVTPQGYSEIARRFGGKDRSTARHACQKIESLMGVDDAITSAVSKIRRMFA